MRMFDTAPLLRSAVGFDNINRLLDSVTRLDPSETAYPPYDIEKVDDDSYRISMAVAGFTEPELDVVVKDGQLEISGKTITQTDNNGDESSKDAPTYLHLRGDEKNPDKDAKIEPGVPAILAGFARGPQPIKLPHTTFAPGSREYVQADHLAAAGRCHSGSRSRRYRRPSWRSSACCVTSPARGL